MTAVTVEQEHPFALIAEDLASHGLSVRDHVIPVQLVAELAKRAKSADRSIFHRAGIGRRLQFEQDASTRRDEIHWLDAGHSVEQQWLAYMSELQTYLNRSLFLGLFSYECHFAHYSQGAFYKKHLDAFRGDANRTLTTVLYLNREWSEQNGGELVVYSPDDADRELCRVLPEFGRLCVFLSEEFPHEVLPVAESRWSIAGWFRVNTSIGGVIDPPK